jgi:hypothetical protein
MKTHKALRVSLAIALGGGTMLSSGCGDILRRSIRDGMFALVAGTATGYFDPAVFGDLITNLFTGGFTGGFGGGFGGFDLNPWQPRT